MKEVVPVANNQRVGAVAGAPAIVFHDPAAAQHPLQLQQHRVTFGVLTDPEFRDDLKTERQIGTSLNPDRECSLTVDESS